MKEILRIIWAFTMGYLLCAYTHDAEAQTYVITNPAGYSQGTIQIQGNQGQIVNNAGRVTQSVTVYPNQVVTPSGYAVGTPSYTVPSSPLSPPSPRVLQ